MIHSNSVWIASIRHPAIFCQLLWAPTISADQPSPTTSVAHPKCLPNEGGKDQEININCPIHISAGPYYQPSPPTPVVHPNCLPNEAKRDQEINVSYPIHISDKNIKVLINPIQEGKISKVASVQELRKAIDSFKLSKVRSIRGGANDHRWELYWWAHKHQLREKPSIFKIACCWAEIPRFRNEFTHFILFRVNDEDLRLTRHRQLRAKNININNNSKNILSPSLSHIPNRAKKAIESDHCYSRMLHALKRALDFLQENNLTHEFELVHLWPKVEFRRKRFNGLYWTKTLVIPSASN